jgi:hypothetical protein
LADCAHPDVWAPPPRCTRCGHRVKMGNREPAESKTLPRWTWPFEYLGRLHARLMRNASVSVRDGLQD